MTVRILQGDCRDMLSSLPDCSVQTCVTSPPYFGLRDYGVAGQIGLEPTPAEFVAQMVEVFREVRRVLRDDGTLWLNLGDTYATNGGPGWQGKNGERADRRFTGTRNTVGMREQSRTAFRDLKPKDLIGIPWRVAFALQADGWYLRQDIIWSKPNPMPESVRDRCTKAHEYIFMLSKSPRYYYDQGAIKEPASWDASKTKAPDGWDTGPGGHGTIHRAGREKGKPADLTKPDKQRGHSRRHAGFNDRWDAMERAEQCSGMRNKRSVWTIATQPFSEAHFATFPPELPELCIKAGSKPGDTILDPFGGAGTTGLVADRLGRDAVLIELNPEYAAMAKRRIEGDAPLFAEVGT